MTVSFAAQRSAGSTINTQTVGVQLYAGGATPSALHMVNAFTGETAIINSEVVVGTSQGRWSFSAAVPPTPNLSLCFFFHPTGVGVVTDWLEITDVRIDVGQGRVGTWPGNGYTAGLLEEPLYYQATFPSGVVPAAAAGVTGAYSAVCGATGTLSAYVKNSPPTRNPDYRVTIYNPVSAFLSTGRNTRANRDVPLIVSDQTENGFLVTAPTDVANANDVIRFHYTLDNEPY